MWDFLSRLSTLPINVKTNVYKRIKRCEIHRSVQTRQNKSQEFRKTYVAKITILQNVNQVCASKINTDKELEQIMYSGTGMYYRTDKMKNIKCMLQ